MIMAGYKNVKLSQLIINKDNDRFDESAQSEKDSIEIMLNKFGEKIYRLAQHILTNGLSKKPFLVVPFENKYIVKDGNRRTTALKLMKNPKLIDEKKFPQYRKNFTRLSLKFKEHPILNIHCHVFDTEVEANKWVKLEHTGEQSGIGVVVWNSEQVQRFDIKHGKVPSVEIQTIDLLKNSTFTSEKTLSELDKLPITNLSRLLTDPYVRKKIGIDLIDGAVVSNIEESEVVKGISRLIAELQALKVKDIYTNEDRKKVIDSIEKEELPNLSNKAQEIWSFIDYSVPEDLNSETDGDGESKTKKKRRVSAIDLKRKVLIPKSCIIPICNVKVNKIYNELQQIDVFRYTNCSAVTLRVFIELAVDTYLEKKNLLPEDKITSSKSGLDLFQKVSKVANHLSTIGAIDETISKGIKTHTKDKNSILGIDTLHSYVHSNQMSPTADVLLTTWDNIQEFFVALWSNIEE